MKKYIFILFILSTVLSGCTKFLDVTPEDQVYEKDLFSDRAGFEAAIASVYSSLSSPDLYGREMKFGFLETLVGTYNLPNQSHDYYRGAVYQYNFERPMNSINAIWREQYLAINQLNLILSHIDAIRADPYVNLIEGEVLGLRAFCHLELLKLFGPVIKEEGLDALAIPYRDAVSMTAVKALPARIVLEKIDADLEAARQLLVADPIRENNRAANLNVNEFDRYNSLLDRRGTRFNYYAVVASQAISAQWSGDQARAGRLAVEVIDELNRTRSISLASNADFVLTVNTDKRFAKEYIFGIYTVNFRDQVTMLLPPIDDTRGNVSPLLYPNYNFLNSNLYSSALDGSVNDYRLGSWYAENSRWKFTKFAMGLNLDRFQYADLHELKLIGLHQMYLIAAENMIGSNPAQAIAYLNIVRRARNILSDLVYQPSMSEAELLSFIFRENRKENVGEGTLFSEYKRLYRNIDRSTAVSASLNIFKFPFPADENLYNPTN